MAKENESKISPVLAASLTDQSEKKEWHFARVLILVISLVVVACVILGVF